MTRSKMAAELVLPVAVQTRGQRTIYGWREELKSSCALLEKRFLWLERREEKLGRRRREVHIEEKEKRQMERWVNDVIITFLSGCMKEEMDDGGKK